MKRFRSRVTWVYEQPFFRDDERKGLDLQPKSFWHDWPFVVGLTSILVIACAIVIVHIWAHELIHSKAANLVTVQLG
jgi:hypothetical protein